MWRLICYAGSAHRNLCRFHTLGKEHYNDDTPQCKTQYFFDLSSKNIKKFTIAVEMTYA